MTEQGSPPRTWTARWDEEVAQRWIAVEEAMDRALGPFGEAALVHARPRPGERMIDVGCGCGATTIALAEAAGTTGHVLGVDIAAPMLARARQRAAGRPQVEFIEADAATFAFGDVRRDSTGRRETLGNAEVPCCRGFPYGYAGEQPPPRVSLLARNAGVIQ